VGRLGTPTCCHSEWLPSDHAARPHRRTDLSSGARGSRRSTRSPARRRHFEQLALFLYDWILRLGADLQDVSGQVDPRTTWRYDRSRHNVDRSPDYLLAAALTSEDL
jgi:hypothetical protein